MAGADLGEGRLWWIDHSTSVGLALWLASTGFCALFVFLVLIAY